MCLNVLCVFAWFVAWSESVITHINIYSGIPFTGSMGNEKVCGWWNFVFWPDPTTFSCWPGWGTRHGRLAEKQGVLACSPFTWFHVRLPHWKLGMRVGERRVDKPGTNLIFFTPCWFPPLPFPSFRCHTPTPPPQFLINYESPAFQKRAGIPLGIHQEEVGLVEKRNPFFLIVK